MNINDFMQKLVIVKNKDASYSETGRKDFEAQLADVVDIQPRVKAPRNVPVSKQNNSY